MSFYEVDGNIWLYIRHRDSLVSSALQSMISMIICGFILLQLRHILKNIQLLVHRRVNICTCHLKSTSVWSETICYILLIQNYTTNVGPVSRGIFFQYRTKKKNGGVKLSMIVSLVQVLGSTEPGALGSRVAFHVHVSF